MTPPPLIVKSPYFQSWVDTDANNTNEFNMQSVFWDGGTSLQWASLIRVDNATTYDWIGEDISTKNKPNLTAINITPTRTIFTFEAGSIGFNATFLSPIDPSDLVRQSLPFGYIYVDVWSLDGKPHSIQLYFDTGGDILNNLNNVVQWNTTSTENIVYHNMTLSNPQPFVEDGDIANDATLYLAMENKYNMTWQIGDGVALRGRQVNSTVPLSNTDTSPAESINMLSDSTVLAFRVDLGLVNRTNESVVWAMGLMRDPAIRDISFGSTQLRRSYYWSAYESVDDIITDVIGNFNDIKSKSINLDNKIMTDGAAISPAYVGLLSRSLRLTFGAMDITIAGFPNGTTDSSDVKIFMKDIGTSNRVSPVEILYASLPAALYLNSSLASFMLEPLLKYQNSSNYNNAYAAPDLGQSYPNVTGNLNFNKQLAIESCSSMLIMAFAHASKSGDGTLLNQYYNLLNQWAQYLGEIGLDNTNDFMTSDGDSGPYLSNLVLQGIMGIYAMSRISDAAGRSADSSQHLSRAKNYTSQWKQLALSSGHIISVTENMTSSWGLAYNLYAAKLLSAASLIDDTVYTQQSQFYASQVATAPEFGFPYAENAPSIVKSHWTIFTAAAMVDTSVRDSLIGMVSHKIWGIFNGDDAPPPSSYDAITGKPITGVASPAHGAMYALLALNLTDKQISGFSSAPRNMRRAKNIGAIAGGTVAGVLGLCVVLFSVFKFLCKRGIKRKNSAVHERTVTRPFQVPHASNTILTNWARNLPVMSKRSIKLDTNIQSEPEGQTPAVETSVPGPTSSSGPSADIIMEVERLRREMDEIRNERIHETEPPPLYELGHRSSTVDHVATPSSA